MFVNNPNNKPIIFLAYNYNDGTVDLSDNIQMLLMTTPLSAVFSNKSLASIPNVNNIWELNIIHIIKNISGQPSQCHNTPLLLFSRIPSFESYNSKVSDDISETIISIIPPEIYQIPNILNEILKRIINEGLYVTGLRLMYI